MKAVTTYSEVNGNLVRLPPINVPINLKADTEQIPYLYFKLPNGTIKKIVTPPPYDNLQLIEYIDYIRLPEVIEPNAWLKIKELCSTASLSRPAIVTTHMFLPPMGKVLAHTLLVPAGNLYRLFFNPLKRGFPNDSRKDSKDDR